MNKKEEVLEEIELDDFSKEVLALRESSLNENLLDTLTEEELEIIRRLPENIGKNGKKNYELFKRFQYAHLEPAPEKIETVEQIALEMLKCKYNILYFLMNYARIPLKGGGSIKILMNDKLKTVALLFQGSVICTFQTSRQSSKTTIILTCVMWYTNFWQNTSILFFNIKAKENKKNLRDIRKMIELLPKWMRTYDPKRDPTNVESFRNGIESEIILETIPKEDPESAARGNSSSVYLDECGFLKNIRIAFTAIAMVYQNYARISRDNYVPAPFSITSTPQDPANEDGKFFMDMWNGSSLISYEQIKDLLPYEIYNYCAKILKSLKVKVYQPWYEYPNRCAKELYDSENPDNILHLLNSPLGKFEEIRKHSEAAYEYLMEAWEKCLTVTKFRREVLCEFLSNSDESIFAEELLNSMIKAEPVRKVELVGPQDYSKVVKSTKAQVDTSRQYLNIYKDLTQKETIESNFIIAIDPANTGQDYTGIVIFDPSGMSVVGVAYLKVKAIFIEDIIIKIHHIFPQSLIIIERNNFGSLLIDHLMEKAPITLVRRLYYHYKNKKKKFDADQMVYGFQTSNKNREQMLEAFIEFVNMNPDSILSKDIISEMFYLTYNKNGKAIAATGHHDDLIMALSMVLYLLKFDADDLRKFRMLNSDERKIVSKLNSANLMYGMDENREVNQRLNPMNLQMNNQQFFMKSLLAQQRAFNEAPYTGYKNSADDPLAEFKTKDDGSSNLYDSGSNIMTFIDTVFSR